MIIETGSVSVGFLDLFISGYTSRVSGFTANKTNLLKCWSTTSHIHAQIGQCTLTGTYFTALVYMYFFINLVSRQFRKRQKINFLFLVQFITSWIVRRLKLQFRSLRRDDFVIIYSICIDFISLLLTRGDREEVEDGQLLLTGYTVPPRLQGSHTG